MNFLILSIFWVTVLGVTIYIFVNLTIKRNKKWGINLNTDNHCPKCEKSLLVIRKPTSVKQFMWGGWTCNNCGCQIDKWGEEIAN
jgi:transcription elongation factor Elf1